MLPAASAGANFAAASWRGKFHGTIAATGPSGRQRTSLRTGRPSVMRRVRGGQAGEVAQAGRRAGDLRVRLGQGLSLFPGEQPGEVVPGRLDRVGGREQRAGAGVGIGAPAVPGPAGPVDDGVQHIRSLVGGLVEDRSGGRIDDRETCGPLFGGVVG